MSFWQGIVDYFFPPKCVACRRLIDKRAGDMCETCDAAYREAKERVCSLCLNPLPECDCPNRYMERNNLHTLVKLYRYQAGEIDLPENKVIYRLKKTSDGMVIKFIADELSPLIKRHIKENREYILVGVPRSAGAIRRYGADHIALLCKELSKQLGIPYCKAVQRIGHSKAQKTKNRDERIASAITSYKPKEGIVLKGKTVILIDDVATSGASLVACAKVVRRMGAKTVISAVAGVSFRYRDLLTDSEYYSERQVKYGI